MDAEPYENGTLGGQSLAFERDCIGALELLDAAGLGGRTYPLRAPSAVTARLRELRAEVGAIHTAALAPDPTVAACRGALDAIGACMLPRVIRPKWPQNSRVSA